MKQILKYCVKYVPLAVWLKFLCDIFKNKKMFFSKTLTD